MEQTCLKRLNSRPLPDTDPAKKGKRQVASTSAVPAYLRTELDEALDSWYPNLLSRAYFVPTEYKNKTLLIPQTISGVEVNITQAPLSDVPRGATGLQESAVRDDQSQQRVLYCLKMVANQQQEPMMVVIKLHYHDYLAGIPKTCKLPKPTDLKKENQRGDFDLLIIHRVYGLFVAEIKIVGDIPENMTSTGKPKDKTKLGDCINKSAHSDPADLCLCADDLSDLSDPLHITPAVIKNLSQWFDRTIHGAGADPAMSDEVYRDVVGRFAGPCTKLTPDLRTRGQAVSFTADNFGGKVFTSQQEEVLNPPSTEPDPLVFITGPPGTGKTLVLTVQANRWSQTENGVHLLSTWSGSLAASLLIKHEIEKMNRNTGSVNRVVKLHQFDLKEDGMVEKAVGCLLEAAGNSKQLCVIADEAFGGSQFGELCEQLHDCIPGLNLWSASVYHGYRPSRLKKVIFTQPLRTPPTVTKEVLQSAYIKDGIVEIYKPAPQPTQVSAPSPPPPFWVPSSDSQTKPLRYRDVLIVTIQTSYDPLREEIKDDDGNVVQPASGMVTGLRRRHFPVRIVEAGDAEALEDVVKMTGPDEVIVADADTIRGLERKIVVWVQADRRNEGSGEEDFGRLDAMSRTTAQLIIVS
ncbi:hypothetical protein BaRGS_00039800 [Batillaria attramentaria]|uniref:AAA+ ATPase domain-containing protein n=1 Tax=Batillaria attramentaria TaxID=370345 RepID=A0ABD0J233_9CAEN